MNWYKITNFLQLFSRPLNVKIIALLGENNTTQELSLMRISDDVREREDKVYRYCKKLLEGEFLKCTNNALVEGERGYIKRLGKIPKFELTTKGIAANRIFHFILEYDDQAMIKMVEGQIEVSKTLDSIKADLEKMLDAVRKLKETDRTAGEG
ncbi:MAG: hypothetical protein ACTSRC_19255 [Candidatus Helarchaeota archaeon]